MLATLSSATATPPVFSVANLLILIVVAAVVYPLQKRLRQSLSRRRRERWAEEDRLAELEREQRDRPALSDDDTP